MAKSKNDIVVNTELLNSILNFDLITNSSDDVSMNSNDFAKLTGKRHDNVMSELKKIIETVLQSQSLKLRSEISKNPSEDLTNNGYYFDEYTNTRGQKYKQLIVGKIFALQYASTINILFNNAIIKRWQFLEQENQRLKLELLENDKQEILEHCSISKNNLIESHSKEIKQRDQSINELKSEIELLRIVDREVEKYVDHGEGHYCLSNWIEAFYDAQNIHPDDRHSTATFNKMMCREKILKIEYKPIYRLINNTYGSNDYNLKSDVIPKYTNEIIPIINKINNELNQ